MTPFKIVFSYPWDDCPMQTYATFDSSKLTPKFLGFYTVTKEVVPYAYSVIRINDWREFWDILRLPTTEIPRGEDP